MLAQLAGPCLTLPKPRLERESEQGIQSKVLLQKHTDSSSSEPLDKRLAMIPLSAWEEEDSAELVIREAIRLLFNLGIPIWVFIPIRRRSIRSDTSQVERRRRKKGWRSLAGVLVSF